MRMQRSERKKQIHILLEELEKITKECKTAGMKLNDTYALRRGLFMLKASTWLKLFVVALVIFAAVQLISSDNGVVSVICMMTFLFSMIAAIFCLVMAVIDFCVWLRTGWSVTTVGYSQKDVRLLESELRRIKEELDEFSESREKQRPWKKKFMRLKPIVEKELGGSFSLGDYGKEMFALVTLLDESQTYKLNERRYGALIRDIINTRKIKADIQEFENNLNTTES